MCLPNQPVKKSMTYIAHSSSYALLSQVLNNLYPCDVSTDTHLGIYHSTKKSQKSIKTANRLVVETLYDLIGWYVTREDDHVHVHFRAALSNVLRRPA